MTISRSNRGERKIFYGVSKDYGREEDLPDIFIGKDYTRFVS